MIFLTSRKLVLLKINPLKVLQWHDFHTWKLHHDHLYGNLMFLFFQSPQIYKHDIHEGLWKNLFYRTSKTLQAKFVTFSLPLFIHVTNLTFIRYFIECYLVRIMTRTFEIIATLINRFICCYCYVKHF